MQELLRHSSLRSTLDVYTQAISPAKHAAQAAVLALVFASETNPSALVQEWSKSVKAELVKMTLIDEKRCKKGAKLHPFAPFLVSEKSKQVF
jgi:hypothetical protein